jgi:hypothetical protein
MRITSLFLIHSSRLKLIFSVKFSNQVPGRETGKLWLNARIYVIGLWQWHLIDACFLVVTATLFLISRLTQLPVQHAKGCANY